MYFSSSDIEALDSKREIIIDSESDMLGNQRKKNKRRHKHHKHKKDRVIKKKDGIDRQERYLKYKYYK